MSSKISKVIILVLNWNNWQDTLECLESLYRNSYPDYQVVLIDNNSENDSVQRFTDWADGEKLLPGNPGTDVFMEQPLPYIVYDRSNAEQGGMAEEEEKLYGKLPTNIPHPLIIIQTGNNLGFAGGINVGIRYARHHGPDYVLLFNNDAKLGSRQSITTMIEFMEARPDVGACGGRLFYPDGSAQCSYGNFLTLMRALGFLFPAYKLVPKNMLRNFKRSNVIPDKTISEPLPIDYPTGAFFLVRNETISDIGLLDERFFMYAEETDWCLRMMKRGWNRYYIPQSEAIHKHGGSFNTSESKMNRYLIESLFKYYRKNFTPWRLWIVAAGYVLRSLYSIFHWSTAAGIMPKRMRLPAKEQAMLWRLSLLLAVTTIKDLLNGEIGREHLQSSTEVPK